MTSALPSSQYLKRQLYMNFIVSSSSKIAWHARLIRKCEWVLHVLGHSRFPRGFINGCWPKCLWMQLDRPKTNQSNETCDVTLSNKCSWDSARSDFKQKKNAGLVTNVLKWHITSTLRCVSEKIWGEKWVMQQQNLDLYLINTALIDILIRVFWVCWAKLDGPADWMQLYRPATNQSSKIHDMRISNLAW